MFMKKFGMVAIMLAAVCCVALLVGCADGGGDEDDEWKREDVFEHPTKYTWEKVTDVNKDSVVGEWRINASRSEGIIEKLKINSSYKCTYEATYYQKYTEGNTDYDETKKWINQCFDEIKERLSDSDKTKIEFIPDDKNKKVQIVASEISFDTLLEMLDTESLYISTDGERLLARTPPENEEGASYGALLLLAFFLRMD